MAAARPSAGAWHGRSADHYVTRGAACLRQRDGWFAMTPSRARGPLSSLDAALRAADEMLAQAAIPDAAPLDDQHARTFSENLDGPLGSDPG